MKWLKKFKSHWFYWHTGYRKIAVFSMIASALAQGLLLAIAGGFTLGGILLAVLLDGVGFVVAVFYLLLLRPYLPEWIGLQHSADIFLVQMVVLPMLVGFFLNRIMSFFVAKRCGYDFSGSRHDATL